MFETAYDFLITVPVGSPVLRAFIMLAEIFALGILLYWVWEQVPSLAGRIGRLVYFLRTRTRGAGALDRAHLADVSND